jgi:hypothetical protein
MDQNEKIREIVETLIPKSLDDIIRLNREHAQLRLATEEEIFVLEREVTPGQPQAARAFTAELNPPKSTREGHHHITNPQNNSESDMRSDSSNVKDIIDEWNLIALHQPELNTTLVFLLGNIRRNGHKRITSDVTGIDLDRQFLITKSGSLYQLGTPKNGAPDVDQLYMVCAAFHSWGFGNMLGVPHFFY